MAEILMISTHRVNLQPLLPGPSRLGCKHKEVNQSEIYRVLAELEGIAVEMESKRSLKTDCSNLPAEPDVGHVKIATQKVNMPLRVLGA
jgi:hypothetical protein